MAHDFNNLLTVIQGYSELLLGRLGSTDDMRKDMEEVKKAADRASGLTVNCWRLAAVSSSRRSP